jgi:hypothetical protein
MFQLVFCFEGTHIQGYSEIYDQERISHSYELWNDVMQNRDPTKAFRSMFGGCQIVMGMPTFCFWEDILKLYPNAKVILTVRNEHGWWRSVSKDRGQSPSPAKTGHSLRPFLVNVQSFTQVF